MIDELCRRIVRLDADLHAFVAEPARRERLQREAHALACRDDEHTRSALFGVPVGVKDVIHVDGLLTRAGSDVPPEAITGMQATVVDRLVAAGALVAGKTVTAEFASYAPGPTRNPHNRAHTPGGSSSGSAAAVAAGIVPFALGTQTVGSVIRPAAYCGIVGFKPTYGRIPSDGLFPNAPSFDTVGVLGADLDVVGMAASVLCDEWQTHAAVEGRPVVGVPEGPYLAQADAEALTAFAAQTAGLVAGGISVRRVDALADIAAVVERNHVINRFEFARSHADLFPRFEHRYRQQTAASIRLGREIVLADYTAALAAREQFAADLVALMDAAGIDVWVAPSATGPAPLGLATTGDPAMNLPWTQARLPVVSVPAGVAANGLPVGLQIVGRPGRDEELLAFAAILGRRADRS